MKSSCVLMPREGAGSTPICIYRYCFSPDVTIPDGSALGSIPVQRTGGGGEEEGRRGRRGGGEEREEGRRGGGEEREERRSYT